MSARRLNGDDQGSGINQARHHPSSDRNGSSVTGFISIAPQHEKRQKEPIQKKQIWREAREKMTRRPTTVVAFSITGEKVE
jgi:hypothetical protein